MDDHNPNEEAPLPFPEVRCINTVSEAEACIAGCTAAEVVVVVEAEGGQDLPVWEAGPLEDAMRRRDRRGRGTSKAPKKNAASLCGLQWRVVCVLPEGSSQSIAALEVFKAAGVSVVQCRTPYSVLQMLAKCVPHLYAPRLTAALALVLHGLCPIENFSRTSATFINSASPNAKQTLSAFLTTASKESLYSAVNVVVLRGGVGGELPIPSDFTASTLFAGTGYGRYGFHRAGLEKWKQTKRTYSRAEAVVVWVEAAISPTPPASSGLSGLDVVEVLSEKERKPCDFETSIFAQTLAEYTQSEEGCDSPPVLAHYHAVSANAADLEDYAQFLHRLGRLDEVLMEGDKGAKILLKRKPAGRVVATTIERLTAPGGELEVCVNASGVRRGVPFRFYTEESAKESNDVILSEEMYQMSVVVGSVRSSGKICFITALSTDPRSSCKMQIVARPVKDERDTALLNPGQMHIGDTITVWGPIGASAKGLSTVFALRLALTQGLHRSFVLPKGVPEVAHCASVPQVGVLATEGQSAGVTAYSKPAGLNPVAFTGMKTHDHPTSLLLASQTLAAVEDGRTMFCTQVTKLFPSYLALPRDASGLCIASTHSVEAVQQHAATPPPRKTRFTVSFLALCNTDTLAALDLSRHPTHIRTVATIPTMHCTLAVLSFSLAGHNDALPDIETFCDVLPGATKAKGEGEIGQLLVATQRLSVEYGIVGQAKTGATAAAVPAGRPDAAVFLRYYALRRPFLHLFEAVEHASRDVGFLDPLPLPQDLQRVLNTFPGEIGVTEYGRELTQRDTPFFASLLNAPVEYSEVFTVEVQAQMEAVILQADFGCQADGGTPESLLLHDLVKKVAIYFEKVLRTRGSVVGRCDADADAMLLDTPGSAAQYAATDAHLFVSLPTLIDMLDKKRFAAYVKAHHPSGDGLSFLSTCLLRFLESRREALYDYFGVEWTVSNGRCRNPYQHGRENGGCVVCDVSVGLGVRGNSTFDVSTLHKTLPMLRERLQAVASQYYLGTDPNEEDTPTRPQQHTQRAPTPGDVLLCLGNASGRLQALAQTELTLLFATAFPEGITATPQNPFLEQLRHYKGVYRVNFSCTPTLSRDECTARVVALTQQDAFFASSLQCVAVCLGEGETGLEGLRAAPQTETSHLMCLVTGPAVREAGDAEEEETVLQDGDAFPFVVSSPPPEVVLRILRASNGKKNTLAVLSKETLLLGQPIWRLGATATPVFARQRKFLELWELKPFGFSGSMEGRVAAVIMHCALQKCVALGLREGCVVDACCGSGGLSSAAAYLFGQEVFSSELRMDFAQKSMLNFTHLGVPASLPEAGMSVEGPGTVNLLVHDASKPYPASLVKGAKVRLVVANPPWGVKFGSKSEAYPILTNLMASFPDALWCFIAPFETVSVIAASGVTVLSKLPFGSVQIVLACNPSTLKSS